MAEVKTPSMQYLSGDDPEIIAANKRYQDAVARLSESLSNRKMMFDPTMLAMAEGFLSPTQTGGFGESLGKVAGKVGAAQATEDARQQALNEREVAVAAQGIELQRMKARDADLLKYLGGPSAGPVAGPQAGAIAGHQAGPLSSGAASPAPSEAEPSAPGALSQATPVKVVGSPQGALAALESGKPPGFEGVEGIQVMPANPNFMTARDYVLLNRMDKTKSAADLIKTGQEIEQKRFRDKEGGVQDLATGKFYQFPTGKTEEVQIYGYPGTHKVDARTAARLSLLAANNDPSYHDVARRVMQGPDRRVSGEPGAPTEGIKSVQQLALEAKENEGRAAKLGEESAKKEAGLGETDASARRVFGSVTRVSDYLKQSPNYFGIFARPGVVAAIGNLVAQGIQTPNGSLNLAGLEDSMRKLMPGVTQKDLDNVTKAGTELAEIELAFTRLYLAQQGAVTEGERKIVRAIPGTTSSSPEVLRTRMELLKSRSQYDIDVVDAFRQYQDKNPGRSYFEFERKSDLYKQIRKDFEAETERIFGGIKAVPTRERNPTPSAGQPSTGFERGADGVIRRKKAGE